MDDVKVGDLVLYPVTINYSMWDRGGIELYIAKKVIRLTKTLIIIEGDLKFKRENGFAYFTNDWSEIKHYNKEEDQTELFKEMRAKRTLLHHANEKATILGKTSLEHLFTEETTKEQIELIITKLEELQNLISKNSSQNKHN